jgi:alpha/beta superfamily hydrolase
VADDIAAGPDALVLTTADGLALEGELTLVPDAVAAVVLAHPHPQQGGSMRSLVTSELFRGLPGHGVSVLRFNFRGVERSEGTHGGGRDERQDITAALDAMAARAGDVPLVLCGWSFGADVSLTVTDPRIAAWYLIAPPLRVVPMEEMGAATDPRTKHVLVPENDQFRPPDSLRAATAGWISTEIEEVPGAGHFLVGKTDAAVESVAAFARALPHH